MALETSDLDRRVRLYAFALLQEQTWFHSLAGRKRLRCRPAHGISVQVKVQVNFQVDLAGGR
jgi:hypothetical protein